MYQMRFSKKAEGRVPASTYPPVPDDSTDLSNRTTLSFEAAPPFLVDPVETRISQLKLGVFGGNPNVLVLASHEPTMEDILDLFPKSVNGWKVKDKGVWLLQSLRIADTCCPISEMRERDSLVIQKEEQNPRIIRMVPIAPKTRLLSTDSLVYQTRTCRLYRSTRYAVSLNFAVYDDVGRNHLEPRRPPRLKPFRRFCLGALDHCLCWNKKKVQNVKRPSSSKVYQQDEW
ncbi:hypothetical protein C8J56DRAFT_915777 [Mycena floridula]|nr:hypothetical protein C8J56DRAFT_915777 [Mycena floridula]